MTVVSINTGKDELWWEAREIAKEYLEFLVAQGWGMYRIGREHGLTPIYPMGQGNGEGVWTQEWITDRMADYLYEGKEILDV